MGKPLVDSINTADGPSSWPTHDRGGMFVLINFIVDVVYTLIDPRIDLR